MKAVYAGLALGIPWLAGTLWVRALWQDSAAGRGPLALGYGYFLGLLVAVLLLRAQVAVGGPLDWVGPTLLCGLIGVAGGMLLWRRTRWAWPTWVSNSPQPNWLQQGLFGLLLAGLGWRLAVLAQEIVLRPLYPWDAWTTWGVRARVWAELQHLVPFVAPDRWLADTSGSLYTIDAWQYPETVSLLALWPTLAFGTWHEPAAQLPWLGIALALGFSFYGQARLWGSTPLTALAFVWLLLSLPMFDTHIALAGYADVWLAAIFGLAVCAFLQWARTGDRWQGILALLMALACPWIKREGLVWALLLVPAALVVWTPRRHWPWLAGGLLLMMAAWFAAGGVTFTVAGWGEVRLTPEVIQLPLLGRFELQYHDIGGPVARNLLLLGNWHLFGYLLVAVLLVALPPVLTAPWRLAGWVLASSGLLVLFLLFFFTEAYHWAQQYTSVNRVFLHFVPALLFWILTVLQAPPATSGSERGS